MVINLKTPQFFLSRSYLFLLAATVSWPLFAQDQTADSLRVEGYYTQLSRHCYSNLDSTLYYLDQLLEDTESLGWTEEQAYAYLWGILCTGYHDQIDLKYDLLTEAEQLIIEKGATLAPDILAAIELDLRMHWGDYYLETGGYNGALNIYETLAANLENQEELTDEEYQRLVIANQYLATIHRSRGSHRQAIDYSFRALNYERQYYASRGEEQGDESLAYSRMAGSYWLLGEKARALSYYRPAFEKVQRAYQADPTTKRRLRKRLINMGLEISSYYRELEKPDSALYFLEQVIPHTSPDDLLRQELHLEQAKIWSQQEQYALALDTLREAMSTLPGNRKSPKASLLSGRLFNGLGDVYQARESYPEALRAYQSALEQFSEHFKSGSLQQNPEVSASIAPRELLYTLTQKTRLLLLHPPDESVDWTAIAWTTANLGMDLVDSIKISYTSDYDKQYLLEDCYELYELGLQIVHQRGEDYTADALEIMERSKAVALFAAVRDLHARTYAGVPKEQLEKLRRIQYQLKKIDAQLEEIGPEAQQIARSDKKLNLKSTYDALIRSFETNYPNYYRLKYEQDVVDHQDLTTGNLLKDQMLVEFFTGAEHLYAFVSDGTQAGHIRLHELPWNTELKQWTIDLKKDLYERNDDRFRQKAEALYQALLKPVLPSKLPERLLIIPDGVLGYLPFDILLTESVASGQAGNFRNYPFLMQQTAVSQNFSLSMLREMQTDRIKNTQDLLAFAPGFPNNPLIAERNNREELGELLYNEAEAKAVLQSFAGKLVADQEATKQQFLELAPQFRIYHIASHAVVNDQAPNSSFIAFAAADSNVNHSRLYSHEILAQSFPADLVVLSACETGVGKVLRGEGMMSLARAFSYAGARSLITSLWNVNDQSGKQLMDVFYSHLKDGLPKDEALRRAKLNYLENAPDNARAHPKYWAAFTPTGNMEALKRNWNWRWEMLAFLLAGFLYLATLKKRP